MPLRIPSEDRIMNYWDYIGGQAPEGFDPTDPSLVNANWVMQMLDKVVNGQYATKSFNVVNTFAELPSNAEQGQTAYVIESDYKNSFFIYNGEEWTRMVSLADMSLALIWGTIVGNIYDQQDLWEILLKGLNSNNALAEIIGGYPKDTILRFYDGNSVSYLVSSLVDNNMEEPSRANIQYRESDTGKKWKCIERIVIKTYKSNANWYRLWSDGWCEQGGRVSNSSTSVNSFITIPFLQPFEDTNYQLHITPWGKIQAGSNNMAIGVSNATTTSADIICYSVDVNPEYVQWEAKGYCIGQTYDILYQEMNIQNGSNRVEQIGEDIEISANDTIEIELAGAGISTGGGGIVKCTHTFNTNTTLKVKRINGRYNNQQLGLVLEANNVPILAAGGAGFFVEDRKLYGGSGYIGGNATTTMQYYYETYKGYSYDSTEGNSTIYETGSCGRRYYKSENPIEYIAYGGSGYVHTDYVADTTTIYGSNNTGNFGLGYVKIYKVY